MVKLVTQLFLPVILLFPCTSVFAQAPVAAIKGWVVKIDGKPATFVTLRLQQSKKNTNTDKDGFFLLRNLPEGNDTLLIAVDNVIVYKQGIEIKRKGIYNLDTIRLTNKVAQLQKVEIIGRKSKSYKSDYSFFGDKTQTPIAYLPQSISTVTSELIKDKMEFTLKDAMNDIAGVNQYSGYDEYTIRGFRAENARDINGLRGYNTTYTSSMLVNIDRVEVIKGPTATLYGNCDPGGTINLVTKKPLDTVKASVDIYQGSWSHFRAEADVTGPLNQNKTLLYRFNGGYDDGNSFRAHVTARSYEFAPSISYIPNDKLQFNIDFSISNISTVLDPGQPVMRMTII